METKWEEMENFMETREYQGEMSEQSGLLKTELKGLAQSMEDRERRMNARFDQLEQLLLGYLGTGRSMDSNKSPTTRDFSNTRNLTKCTSLFSEEENSTISGVVLQKTELKKEEDVAADCAQVRECISYTKVTGTETKVSGIPSVIEYGLAIGSELYTPKPQQTPKEYDYNCDVPVLHEGCLKKFPKDILVSLVTYSFWTKVKMKVQEDALYLFFETKNAVTMQGDIGVAKSVDKGATWKQLGIALDEEWHLSYPYVFYYHGQIYMMPESCEEGELRLYKAVKFPWQWVLKMIIMNKPLVDAFILNHDGTHWLFGSNHSGFGFSKNGQLEIWYSDSPLGPWKPHKKKSIYNTVKSAGARNGGRPFVYNGHVYRTGQDCGETYGRRVRTFKVETFTKDEYKEVEVPQGLEESGKGRNAWNGVRYHHLDVQKLSSDKWIAVMDGDRVPSGDSVHRLILGYTTVDIVAALVIVAGVLFGAIKCIVPTKWCSHSLGKRSDGFSAWEHPYALSSKLRGFCTRLNRTTSYVGGKMKSNTCSGRLALCLLFVTEILLRSAKVSLSTNQQNSPTNFVSHTQFFDATTIQVYTIAHLLLNFLSVHAKEAPRRAHEVGFINTSVEPIWFPNQTSILSWSSGRWNFNHTIYISSWAGHMTSKKTLEVSWFEKDSRASLVNTSCLPTLLNSLCLHKWSYLFNIFSQTSITHVYNVWLDHVVCGHFNERPDELIECDPCNCTCFGEVMPSFHLVAIIAYEDVKVSAWSTGQTIAELLKIPAKKVWELTQEDQALYLYTPEQHRFTGTCMALLGSIYILHSILEVNDFKKAKAMSCPEIEQRAKETKRKEENGC